MTIYPDLPTPAGPWAKRCACGQPAALVHDGWTWCIACHMTDLVAPRPAAPDPVGLRDERPRRRAVRHRRSGRRSGTRDQGDR